MARRELRFGVRDGDRCAATWKLWTETTARQAEVYLANRSLRGELHASMHENGGWHVTHTKEYFENEVKGAIPWLKERYTERWPRPPMIAPGVTLAFQIVTPWHATTSEIRRDKAVVWIPNAPPGKATTVGFFLTKPGVSAPPWPVIGSLPLKNEETAWVVHVVTDAPDLGTLPPGRGAFYRGKGPDDFQRAGRNLRILIFGDSPNGARFIVDCAILPPDLSSAREPQMKQGSSEGDRIR